MEEELVHRAKLTSSRWKDAARGSFQTEINVRDRETLRHVTRDKRIARAVEHGLRDDENYAQGVVTCPIGMDCVLPFLGIAICVA